LINEGDIDFIRNSLDDIYTHRERPVTVKYFEIEYDPLTGVEIGRTESTREVSAVVTELSKGERANMREYENGVYIEQGDIKADIKIEQIEDIASKITQMSHSGREFEILSYVRKGIGERNRYELTGRELT